MRDGLGGVRIPDFAALHPGYKRLPQYLLKQKPRVKCRASVSVMIRSITSSADTIATSRTVVHAGRADVVFLFDPELREGQIAVGDKKSDFPEVDVRNFALEDQP